MDYKHRLGSLGNSSTALRHRNPAGWDGRPLGLFFHSCPLHFFPYS